eukprot:357749-Chlamydomonas_euryale.AAC.1
MTTDSSSGTNCTSSGCSWTGVGARLTTNTPLLMHLLWGTSVQPELHVARNGPNAGMLDR